MPIEPDTSTLLLIDYLNPSLKEIEDAEIIQAAKFVHWAQNDETYRQTQIEAGIAHFTGKVASYAKQYGLDGMDDTICIVVADVRHQGRAKSAAIMGALQRSTPMNALLSIGEPKYHTQLAAFCREITALIEDGTFGSMKYSIMKNDFV